MANTALSSIDPMREMTMQTIGTSISGSRRLAARAVIAAGFALLLCGCNTDQQATATLPDPPNDYRLRHPITMQESDRSIEIFIGSNRGELTPTQRAQILAFGLAWKREATGGIVISQPVGGTNQAAAADAMREIMSILAASGMPPQSIVTRTYPVQSTVSAVRISYPKIVAQAGPCGTWPKDLGPSMNRDYFENRPWWNQGCATQRNLAAMVADPADLVQPRAETATYTARRTTVIEKYRQGINPSTTDSGGSQSAKITDIGK
jgi:pilus assembly protein CpaD